MPAPMPFRHPGAGYALSGRTHAFERQFGRYAYGNQPTIAQWNLARFAETLLPLLDPNPERAVELANEAISAFTSRFQEHWLAGMRDKLGLSGNEEGDPPAPTTVGLRGGDRAWSLRGSNPTHALRQ